MSRKYKYVRTTHPTKAQTQNDLEQYLQIIRNCIKVAWGAWDELATIAPHLFKPLDPRARACFVHCHIREAVKQTFDDGTGIFEGCKTFSRGGVFWLNIKNRYWVRFKKMTADGMYSNIPTAQQSAMAAQQMELDIEGVPSMEEANPPMLVAGYVLDRLQTEMSQFLLVYPLGKSNLWSFPLLGTKIEVEPIETDATEPIKPPTLRRKGDKAKDEAEGTKNNGKAAS